MTLNPNIPLQVQTPGANIGDKLSKLAVLRQQEKDREEEKELKKKQTELLDLEIAEKQLSTLDARDQRRFKNLVRDSVVVSDLLEGGDIDGARLVLTSRKNRLLEAQKIDETIDTVETDEALQLLESNPQALLTKTKSISNLGRKIMVGITLSYHCIKKLK